MSDSMFCFQCEQTAGCGGCTGNTGVCGKDAQTARLQDRLTGELIGLARACDTGAATPETYRLMIEGLFMTLTNVSFDPEALTQEINAVRAAKAALVPGCAACAAPCGHNDAYDVAAIWQAEEDVRSVKSLILFGLRGMAAYACHALELGFSDETVNRFLCRGLFALGEEEPVDRLLELALELGAVNLKCMELLDRANTRVYGHPQPTAVPLGVEAGPVIVVSGHDLRDLQLLLEQTAGRGVTVCTHGEMLPAHAYPGLKKYPHFRGHWGTAWHNQRRELCDFPGPILFTTNCLMPLRAEDAHRIFTTGVVDYPGVTHIGPDKDFTALIDKALAMGGFDTPQICPGPNGGSTVTTGFGRQTVLDAAGTVVEAIRSGALGHIFLVGGCDGARSSRSYYTDFVRQAPADSLVLTLGCGKFRFHDMDLGTAAGLPRILDMGQCNDAYGAIQVAQALSQALGRGVNELPLTLVLSWYEQKAVCILLTLLHLGIRNIYLGPTLPAFLSPNVQRLLTERFSLRPVSRPEKDLAEILSR